ncbi:hypothetical protein GW923_00085 [Candidatus Pacearchaeota archaeon]|nr:hypothetical protein [Candidatus Pacearchaeota archaeon]
MPKKLRYFVDKKGNKVYTLQDSLEDQETKSAHYKFIKIKDAPKTRLK